MKLRKIHKMGNGAYTVTLPINDCREMGITRSTWVKAERIDGKIILTPVQEAVE